MMYFCLLFAHTIVMSQYSMTHFLDYLIVSPSSALILPLISSHKVSVATELLADPFDSHSATQRGVRITLLLITVEVFISEEVLTSLCSQELLSPWSINLSCKPALYF